MFESSSEYEDSSDDCLKYILPKMPPRKTTIPEDCQIDQLVLSRASSQAILQSPISDPNISNEPTPNVAEELHLDIDENLMNMQEINEFIYNPVNIPFPESIFDFLPHSTNEIKLPNSNEDYYIQFLQSFLLYYSKSIQNLISLTEIDIYKILDLISKTRNEILFNFLIAVLNFVPTLTFSEYLFYLKKIFETKDESLLIYPALLCKVSNFNWTPTLNDDVFLLQIGFLLCTSIHSHHLFYQLIESINCNSINPEIVLTIQPIVNQLPIQAIVSFINYLKINEKNAEFFINLYLSTLYSYFKQFSETIEFSPIVIESLIQIVPHLKPLIDNEKEEQMVCASAILALIEKIVVCATLLKIATYKQLSQLIEKLKINFSDGVHYLYQLKEQLHLTRTQFERMTVQLPMKEENIFFTRFISGH